MDYAFEGVSRRYMSKKTWSEVTEKHCHTRQLCKEDAGDRKKR